MLELDPYDPAFVLGACVFNLLIAAILFAETLGEAGGGGPS